MPSAPQVVQPPFYDPPIVDYATGQQHSQAWTEYHQSVADQLASLAATMRANQGVTDGSDATAGQIGEYMTMTGTATGLANNAMTPVASLDLTAGDWDVSGNVQFSSGGTGSHLGYYVGIDDLDTYIVATFPTSAIVQGLTTAARRYNIATGATVELMAQASFGGGTMTATGTIRARRAS